MPHEQLPDHAEKGRYTVILFRGDARRGTRTFSIARWSFVLSIASAILLVIALTLAVIVYTPVGARLPIAGKELEKRYGDQIIGIQNQVEGLSREMDILRGYNLRLRKALGENVSADESVFALSAAPDSTRARFSPAEAANYRGSDAASRREHTLSGPAGTPGNPAYSPMGFEERARAELPLTMPADGYLSKSFDPGQFHYGIDIAGKPGTGVLAAADGHIVFAGWTYDDGYSLMIAHAEGIVTVYKHNQSLLKDEGAFVKRGELVALMGSTGRTSSGPHLHFEVWNDGIPDNPQRYLLTTQ